MSLPIQTFEQTLDKVMEGTVNDSFNAEEMHKSKREIEKKMEEFDREKRQKAAKSEEDLGKLVITT